MAYPTQHWSGDSVISLDEGKVIAKMSDVIIDPQTMKVAALVTSKGGLLGREVKYVLGTEVNVWGEDVILISRTAAAMDESEMEPSEGLLWVSEEIQGRDVITQDGTRIGRLADVLIETDGELVGYVLSDVYMDEFPFEEPKRIPVGATESFGRDVLIVRSEPAVEDASESSDRQTVE